MEKFQNVLNSLAKQSKPSSNKKRKWREIEQLKDQFQLERELKELENSLEYMLDDV